MNLFDLIAEAIDRNIHPVCLLCRKQCKKPYTFWSFQMPPDIYCDKFKER